VFKTFNEVLDIFDFKIFEQNEEIPGEILDLLNSRNNAKKEKNYNLADELRDKITNF
jgi:cysteinyl-tRNA synthetase